MLLLSGCFSPVKLPEAKEFELNTVPCARVTRAHTGSTLVVMSPSTSPVFSSTQMVYTTAPYLVAYFAKNKWAEPPTVMLQKLMVQTLQKTHHFHAVIAPPSSAQYDYVLNSQLIDLTQDFMRTPSVIHLTMRVELLKADTNHVIAIRQFTVVEPTPGDSPYGGVIAANRATSRLLKEIAEFCIRRT